MDFLILEEANLLLCPGCICQGCSPGEEGAGSGPRTAAHCGGPGNVNQIPGQSCAGHPCNFAVAVLRVAVSLVIPAEGDAGPYRGGK